MFVRRKCRCKYRPRWFYSKGALLVLIWTLSVGMTAWSAYTALTVHNPSFSDYKYIPLTLAALAAPLSGWLADAKYGNYRVFKAGLVMLFLTTLLNCISFLTQPVIQRIVFEVLSIIAQTGFITGCGTCTVTALQLGLDQMPEASASSIKSFIAWFVIVFAFGCYLSNIVTHCNSYCLLGTAVKLSYSQVWSLFLTFCLSVTLMLDYFLSSKWLIIEPKSPQSLKTIHRVLKFAAKHKFPLSRSAFTYWEEDIPSRIDLGKSKYGGPFTTEQVEDVKTLLRLLLVSVPMAVITSSLFFRPNVSTFLTHTANATVADTCHESILYLFTYNSFLHMVAGALVLELIVCPLLGDRICSTLKRIGATSFLIAVLSLLTLVIDVVKFLGNETAIVLQISTVLYWITTGLLFQVLLTSILEFVCAQSPYNMRGLLVGYMSILLGAALGFGEIASFFLKKFLCLKPWCLPIPASVKTFLSLAGFVSHCVIAHWYKLRVRDEEFSTQRAVEEIYDRYLTQQARAYGH